ncbi:hypothetical protein HPB49_009600 [Dermacentor silvarum]|uniref:Uncharacterized protein n=1 Tax=Dermacentor silvarum TaxID=543639 RepID=A0ACB8CQU0_DERSI|nr:hypothetical protein HPB49_009600 [Dermacentor silvarum]
MVATEIASSECNTSVCRTLQQWFVSTVVSQADPCRKKNRFVCDASLSLPPFEPSIEKVPAVTGKLTSTEGTEAVANAMAVKSQSKKQPQDSNELFQSCFRYSMLRKEGVEDVLLFLSNFNLDFRHMVEDSNEHPLTRMMELSFDYGIDVPVSFTRMHNIAGDGPQAFVLQVNINQEVNEFFVALDGLDETEVKEFYELCLSHYALLNHTSFAEELIDADVERRWKQLLDAYHSRSQVGQRGNVTADERALVLLAYMSRPNEKLAMRRLLAWHVLLYLVGPKAELLEALSGTQGDPRANNDDVLAAHPRGRCARMMTKLDGVRYRALDILEGNGAVPVDTIAKVAIFMDQFQSAIAFVYNSSQQIVRFASPASSTTLAAAGTPSKEVALFPKLTSPNGAPGELFTAMEGAKKETGGPKEKEATEAGRSFPLLWLRHLRAWHALPPLVQALLPVMVSLDKDRPASFFRLPYYDAAALPAYNFAGLGQVIARAFVHRNEEMLRHNPAMRERWNRFWGATGAINRGATYCLVTGRRQNDTSRRGTPNGTRTSEWVIRDQGPTLKLSYLAFLRSRRTNTGLTKPKERLAGIRLSREQLFLTMHCALSCSMGVGLDTTTRQMTTRQKKTPYFTNFVIISHTSFQNYALPPYNDKANFDLTNCHIVPPTIYNYTKHYNQTYYTSLEDSWKFLKKLLNATTKVPTAISMTLKGRWFTPIDPVDQNNELFKKCTRINEVEDAAPYSMCAFKEQVKDLKFSFAVYDIDADESSSPCPEVQYTGQYDRLKFLRNLTDFMDNYTNMMDCKSVS